MFITIIISLIILLTVCNARNPFPDQTDDNFQNDCLQTSNDYRAKHHAPSFQLDSEAVDYAKSRCQLDSQYEGLSRGHEGLQGYGENLYWGGNSIDTLSTCSQAITAWYNEVNDYDFNNPGFSSSTGHFTQLVWVSSTAMGCARCGGQGSQWYETYIVCNYKPPGNVVSPGYFEENVLRA